VTFLKQVKGVEGFNKREIIKRKEKKVKEKKVKEKVK
jgi:hypothetical protein